MTIARLVLVLASMATPAAGTTPQAPQAPAPSEQDLFLRVSTHSGPLPLELVLVGELKGIDLATVKSCSIRVERTYVMASGMKLDERVEHPCVQTAEGLVSNKFERTLTLAEPGDYLLRIMLEPKEGRTMAGMTHSVKAYKAPFQVGVKGTRTD